MTVTWNGSIIRTTARANIRRGPSRASAAVRVADAGESLLVAKTTDSGEAVAGNSRWFELSDGTFLWSGAATGVEAPLAPLAVVAPPAGLVTDEMGIAASGNALVIDRTTHVLPAGQYLNESTDKDLIVLHFTAGQSARSAVDTWRENSDRIGTAFVVDLDGTIYEVFPPTQWAYHLGTEGTSRHDRRSIGIEIANVGPLKPSPADPSALNWWPDNWSRRYCGRGETGRFIEAPYRGIRHFATFPGIQMDAVGALVRQLCTQHGIPRNLAPLGRRHEADQAFFQTFAGVATHANFRTDKWDIGPAFEWDRLGL